MTQVQTMPLHIYNSLTRKKEVFEPLHPGTVTIYVCGPTVYGHAHLGHAKSYVSFDVVVKWLRHLGYTTKYIQNITDVGHLTDDADDGEDKIAKQARLEKTDPMEIAQYYTRSYYDDMDRLGVQRPNIAPTATGHIPEQIALIKRLIEKGHAYEVNGNVYFSVASYPGYGRLSGRTDQEALQSGSRIESRSEKQHASDFALWKKAEPGHIMKWESPWSTGYPGWHAECSAMAMKYLGETIDIHGGGMENKFPHHECEIAQSEASTGKPYVRYWMHNNMVTVNGTKMGKSLKNSVNLNDLFKTVPPLVIRFFILQSHYRSPLDYSDAAINASRAGLEKLQETWHALSTAEPGNGTIDTGAYEKRFCDAMNDDFNTPVAISVLFDLARAINTARNTDGLTPASRRACDKLFSDYGQNVLGILSPDKKVAPAEQQAKQEALQGVVSILLDLRKNAREERNFALSDLIRNRLAESGITLKDTKEGTEWSLSEEKDG